MLANGVLTYLATCTLKVLVYKNTVKYTKLLFEIVFLADDSVKLRAEFSTFSHEQAIAKVD
jgi:hypothetical protein